MAYFWRIAHSISLFAGFVCEFAAACRVDHGETITAVLPLLIIGLLLMVAFILPAAYEEWREYNE